MPTFRKPIETFEAGVQTLPRRYYADEGIFLAELDLVFAKRWTCVGREDEIENVGDFFLARIARESIIVLRDSERTVRAFYNVCRHRGTALCASQNGSLPGELRCRYHGWTYDLAGRLTVAPHMQEVPNFDKRAYPL